MSTINLLLDIVERLAYKLRKAFYEGSMRRIVRVHEDDVTREVDAYVEDAIYNELSNAGIKGVIIGEEYGEREINGGGAQIFVVDPIDGSANYHIGIPFFSISIAYGTGRKLKDLIGGIVYDVVHGIPYVVDAGATLVSNMPARRQPVTSRALFSCLHETDEWGPKILKYCAVRGCKFRCLGSSSLEIVYTALGKGIAFVDLRNRLRVVDVAAAWRFATELGLKTVEIRGREMGEIDVASRDRLSIIIGEEGVVKDILDFL